METTLPADAIVAVTHPDPYPFYAELVAQRPLHRDEGLGLWVAGSAEAVTAVLGSELGRVRPPGEPVPRALVGTAAGEIFGHLVRMTDGAGHCPLHQAVRATLDAIRPEAVGNLARAWAGTLAAEMERDQPGVALTRFAFQLPTYVVGSLLGLPRDALSPTTGWVDALVSAFAPIGPPERIARGARAAAELLALFRGLLEREPDGLVARLAAETRRFGRETSELVIANAIGFLTQGYEATAGLIGNTLLALARDPGLLRQVRTRPELVKPTVAEVLRHDSPVQNTRRFVARDGTVAGQTMREGDAILVILAAANRDPNANPDPARFDLARSARRTFSLGSGNHACPGETVATTIASAGIERLLDSGLRLERLPDRVCYRPSVNTRIPRFEKERQAR